MLGQCILKKFVINKQIGSGSFGDIYLCTDNQKEQYAAKLEKVYS